MTSGFWAILIATGIYGVIHSLLASLRVKAFAAQWMGIVNYQRYYRLGFVIAAGATFLPILAMAALIPDRTIYSIPTPIRYLTLALQGIALFGILAAVMQTGALRFLGLRQITEAHPDDAGRLVTGGLYRLARHPMYTFSFILLWLAPTMTWNLLAMALGLSAYMLAGAYFFEEPKLAREFGNTYREYRAKTPMIVPGFKISGLAPWPPSLKGKGKRE